MDRTARTLTDLSAVDDQLSGKEALMDARALALEQRRAALREAIPRVFLAAYDALGRVGRRPVVVEVRGGHCGGCYLRLPPQLDSSIRRRQSCASVPIVVACFTRPRERETTRTRMSRSTGSGTAPRGNGGHQIECAGAGRRSDRQSPAHSAAAESPALADAACKVH